MSHYKSIAVILCLLSLLTGCTSKEQQKAAIERTLDEYFEIAKEIWQISKTAHNNDPVKLKRMMQDLEDKVTKTINIKTSNCPADFKKVIHKNESALKKLRGVSSEFSALIDEGLEIQENPHAPNALQRADELTKKLEKWMGKIKDVTDGAKDCEKELLEVARKYGVDTKPYESGMSSSDFKKYEDEQAKKKEEQKEIEDRKEREAKRLAEIEERRYETNRLRVEEERLKTEQKRLEAEKLKIQKEAEQQKIDAERQKVEDERRNVIREREEKEARSRQEKADALAHEREQERNVMEAARLRVELDRVNRERQSEEAGKERERMLREERERNMNRDPRERMEEARMRNGSQPQNQELPKPSPEEIEQFKKVFDNLFEATDNLITVFNDDNSTKEQRKEAAENVLDAADDKATRKLPSISGRLRGMVTAVKFYLSSIERGNTPEHSSASQIAMFRTRITTHNQSLYKQFEYTPPKELPEVKQRR